MISDAVLHMVDAVLSFVVGLLPDDTLDLPTGTSLATWFGEHAGPANKVLPIYEAAVFLELFVGLYLPVVLVYSVTKWIYRHLPVVGKG